MWDILTPTLRQFSASSAGAGRCRRFRGTHGAGLSRANRAHHRRLPLRRVERHPWRAYWPMAVRANGPAISVHRELGQAPAAISPRGSPVRADRTAIRSLVSAANMSNAALNDSPATISSAYSGLLPVSARASGEEIIIDSGKTVPYFIAYAKQIGPDQFASGRASEPRFICPRSVQMYTGIEMPARARSRDVPGRSPDLLGDRCRSCTTPFPQRRYSERAGQRRAAGGHQPLQCVRRRCLHPYGRRLVLGYTRRAACMEFLGRQPRPILSTDSTGRSTRASSPPHRD